jgi:hypothetical protein
MSLLDTASLIVTPNGYKEGKLYSVIPSDGSGDMSVTRATTATRVNSAGLVELVPYNRFQYSEDFTNAIWSKVNTTITSGQTDPFGTSNASRYLNTANGGFILQSGGLVINEVQTISAWVKSNTGSSQTFIFMANSGAEQSPTLTATNQWQRVTWTFTSSANNNVILFYNPSASLDLLIYGTQLVEGSTAKDYQKTETRLNIPRLDYSNGTCPSLLVEPQRTNLLTYSSSFDNAAWTKVQTTTSANVAVSPSGIQDADKLIPNTTSNIHYSFQNISDTIAPWTFSVYAKADGYNRIILNAYNTNFVGFNLTTGTIESTLGIGVTSANIEDAGNGWYRCSITSTSTSSGVAMTMSVFNAAYTNGNVNPIFSGNGTDGVLVWGAQFESGSYPTSYIPTTSASVTRNADVISKTGISSLIGQTEGTLFVDFIAEGFADFGTPLCINDGSTANSIWITTFGNGDIRGEVFGSSNVQATFTYSGGVVGQRYKLALVYKANDFAMYVNGNLIGTDLSGTLPINLSRVDFDYANASLFVKSALEINAAALWQTRLDNATLAQLTTI